MVKHSLPSTAVKSAMSALRAATCFLIQSISQVARLREMPSLLPQ